MLRAADPFDQYGGNAALLTQGVYASATGVTIVNTNPRTGTWHARISPNNGDRGLRRVYGADLQEAGIKYAFSIPTLPTDSDTMILAAWADNAYGVQATLVVSSTGQVILHRGKPEGIESGPVLATSAPVIVAGGYQHFEAVLFCDSAGGACEVRIDGVTVLNVTGVNTQAQASTIVAQVKVGMLDNNWLDFPAYMDVDDYALWDTTGYQNVDFIGDKKIYLLLPNADTAQEDWVPSSGSDSYEMVNNVPPNDAQYIEATTPGNLSRFGLQDLPAEVVSIAGLVVIARAVKTDAGNAKIQLGVSSGGDEAVGDELPLSMAPTYFQSIFELDPDTDAPWTVSGVNAMQLQIERTE